jgi:DUF1009 family protein
MTETLSNETNVKERLGLIAGFGVLPFIFAKENKNFDLYIAGFKKITPKKLSKYSKETNFFSLGDLEKIINFFKKNFVNKILLLGYVPHQILTTQNYNLDLKALNMFSKIKTNTAMNIFGGLLKEFLKENISIEPIDKYLGNMFATSGLMTEGSLNNDEIENIQFGYNIAKEVSKLDIGLTVVVKNKVIVAVEALEGTDRCILRSHKIAGKDCIVIKVARPNQDMRFDLPVIGPKTVKVLKKAKIKVLAVEKNKTLIIDKQNVIKKLNDLGIKLYGI